MDLERFALVKELFLAVYERDPASRAAYLDEACQNDASLRQQVENLLLQATRTGAETRTLRMSDRSDGVGTTTTEALHSAQVIAEGSVLDDKYRIERELGAGAMGRVYRAMQLSLDRPVALKVIAGGASASPNALRRFQREALAVARLRHPNIVVVYDAGAEADAGAYIVMELVDGRSLGAEIRERGRLPLDEALEIVAQACSAVHAAHEAGVIHRDLKPDNIVVERGTALTTKVLDFGIAKLVDSSAVQDATRTGAGILLGTPLYMSPEQCRGEEVDARSDVYALGCVLYEVLTGVPPFSGKSPMAVIVAHLSELPRPPSELREGLPASLDAVVLKAMAKLPSERFASAALLAAALERGRIGPNTSTSVGVRDETRAPGPDPVPPPAHAPALPQEITSFVGRESDVRAVVAMVAESRLVTLTGPGGIGKTRLALAVARAARDGFPDAVCFADLAAVADPALVAVAVAKAVAVSEQPGRPLLETLRAELAGRSVLLVLDNCEHLVAACASLADELLRSCARLHVLATSREVLAVDGEMSFAVPALSVAPAGAPPEALERYDAVRLFVERARLVRHDFALTSTNTAAIAELSRKLEGIPLAIELAAARAHVLGAEQILSKMGDRLRLLARTGRAGDGRHRTLRATIDWSFSMLGEEERRDLEWMAVFAGSWSLAAVEGVIGAEARRLETLTSLVDKSLVARAETADGEPSFRMLDVVREYALEQLEASGQTQAARQAHARYFLELAEAADPELKGARQAEWLDRLKAEHDNLRVALGWLLEHDPDACLCLAAAAQYFWLRHGHYTEGRRWLEAGLERGRTAPERVRRKALAAAGHLALEQADLAAARRHAEERVRLGRETGDPTRIAWGTFMLGDIACMEGDLQSARVYLEESLAGGREAKDDRLVGNALNGLGEVARLEGAWDGARARYEQAVASFRQAGDSASVSISLTNLGAALCEAGDLKGADAAFREALGIARALGDRDVMGSCLEGIGATAAWRGEWARAARLAGAAETLRGEVGVRLDPVDQRQHDRWVTRLREALDPAKLDEEWARGRAMTADEASREALDLERVTQSVERTAPRLTGSDPRTGPRIG